MLEKAIYITNLRKLSYFRNGNYQRIYWGQEFCQNLIPASKETQEVLRFIKKGRLEFTFVTPFVTEQGLRRLKNIFTWLKKQNIKCEIVVNDWGVLEYLRSEYNLYFEIALGRLLTRQQRDPAMQGVLNKQLPFAIKRKDGKISIIIHKLPPRRYREGIKASYINLSLMQGFLAKFGVKRVELNNLIHGLNLEGIEFKKSLYTPFVNIATSRFCPMETRFQKIYRINVCRGECQRHYDILRNKAVPKVIYKRGNTTFYKNPVNIKKIDNSEIDRIVFQPELPF